MSVQSLDQKIPGVGNDNPLQYSCLENPMGRWAWCTAVHGITRNWKNTEVTEHTQAWSIIIAGAPWMELSLYNSLWCGWDWNPQLLSKASGMIEQSPLLPWRNHEWVPNKGTGQAAKWWWMWDEKKKKVWFFLQKTDYFCVGALLVWVAMNTDAEEVLCMYVCICIHAQHTCKWVKVIWLNYMPHSLS